MHSLWSKASLPFPDPRQLGDKMREALGDFDAYRRAMPDTASLKARFGVNVMAADIEKAYFAALSK